MSSNHPDLLYFDDQTKLGIEQAKKVKEHLSLRPYSATGRVVVMVSAHKLTTEAQNSLLKILEEPPEQALIVMAAEGPDNLLPTITSRCLITYLPKELSKEENVSLVPDIEALIKMNVDERFKFIEKLEQKEEFLRALAKYYRSQLKQDPQAVKIAKLILQAEEWQEAHVNIRAILEYLMLEIPTRKN